MNLTRRYAYNVPWRGVAVGAVFDAGLSVLMAVEVALPDTNTRDRLVQFFHDKQIPQSPDLKPWWESRL